MSVNDGVNLVFGGLPGLVSVGAAYVYDSVADWLPLVPSSDDRDELIGDVQSGEVTETIRDVTEDARLAAERVQDSVQVGLTVAGGLTIATTLLATTALVVGVGVYLSKVDLTELVASVAGKAAS